MTPPATSTYPWWISDDSILYQTVDVGSTAASMNVYWSIWGIVDAGSYSGCG